MDYLLHILIISCIYTILSLSLNLLIGYTGILSISQAAFMGVGAYTSALLGLNLGMNFFFSLSVAVLIASILSAIIAIPTIKIKGDYYIIASFGMQIIIYSIFMNWDSLTYGAVGLTGIPKPKVFGYEIISRESYFLLTLFFTIIIVLFINRLASSPFGKILKAIREDEIATQAMGKNVISYKTTTFIIGCTIASVAGSLYAHYITFIDPLSFTLEESIFILSLVIIGGAGNIKGPILGAVILTVLPEVLRFINIPSSIAGPARQMIYGALLIIFMLFRPQGLFGEYKLK